MHVQTDRPAACIDSVDAKTRQMRQQQPEQRLQYINYDHEEFYSYQSSVVSAGGTRPRSRAATVNGGDRQRTGSNCSTSLRCRSLDTDIAATRSPPPGDTVNRA